MNGLTFILIYLPVAPVDAPIFDRVFAGVENTSNSGTMHTILVDTQGQSWATSSNKNGQLYLGSNGDQVTIPE